MSIFWENSVRWCLVLRVTISSISFDFSMMKFLTFPIPLRKHFVKWSIRIKWDIYEWFSHTVLYSYYIEQFVDEKKSPFAYGIQICYSNMATTMHKEDCPNLDPEQIMAIDCTYVYWTRSKERLFFSFYPTGCSSRAMPLLAWARKWRFIGHQQFGCPQGAIRFTKAKERRHHSTWEDWGLLYHLWRKLADEELLRLQLFLAAPGNRHF